MFTYDEEHTIKAVVLFKYKNRRRCSEIGKTHHDLPSVPVHAGPGIHPYVSIGAGSAFLGEDNYFSINDGLVTMTVPVSTQSETDVGDQNENERREAMMNAIKTYIHEKRIKLTVSTVVRTAGAEYCPFTGGGDGFLFGKKAAMVLDITDEADELSAIETEADELSIATAIETKVQAVSWTKIRHQLKANMMVCTTTEFAELCKKKPKMAKDIKVLQTFGLIVGLGKPVYLISSTMQFDEGKLEYRLEMQHQWGSKAAIYIDKAVNFCITRMT